MSIIGTAEILIEPDDQYTTTVTSIDTATGARFSVSTPAGNQTLTVAFNKARDDLAALITAGLKVKNITIKATIE